MTVNPMPQSNMSRSPISIAPGTPTTVRVIPEWGRDEADEGFGGLSSDRGHLPLKAMRVRGQALGLVGQVEVSQTFVNTFEEAIEATYIFPLPARGAVTSFKMVLRDRIIDGVLEERGKARERYDAAIAAGKRAAIAEPARPEVFTMRVGNLMPGEEATVRLELTTPLPYEDGEVTFRFPLLVAPRYVPGRPLSGPSVGDGTASDTDAAPDASRISPPVLLEGYPNPVQLEVSLNIDGGGAPVRDIRSSLHAVATWADASTGRTLVKLQPGERLNRDVVIRWTLGREEVGSSLRLCPDDEGDEGTLMLTVLPPVLGDAAIRPRDVTLVLDRSGSMSGWKMVAARRAVAEIIDTLGEQDRFNVLAFDDAIEAVPGSNGALLPATWRNRSRALRFIRGVNARGGTEMAQPLMDAARQMKGGYQGRDRSIVLITDGQVANERQIASNLGRELSNVRVYTVGIDSAVNGGFLEQLARIGGGACELVESEERLDEVMGRLHRMIDTPVLTELGVDLSGAALLPGTLVPRRAPDLFAQAPVTFLGRYKASRPDAPVTAHLSGCTPEGERWSERLAGEPVEHDGVRAIWARGQLQELEDQHDAAQTWGHHSANPDELRRQIIETSLRFGVLCRFTAFVAVDREETVDTDRAPHKVIQAVEAPASAAQASPMMNLAAPSPAPGGPNVRTMALDLDAFSDGSAGGAPPPSPMAPMSARYSAPSSASPTGAFRAMPPSLAPEAKKRSFALPIVALLVALVGMAGIGLLVWWLLGLLFG